MQSMELGRMLLYCGFQADLVHCRLAFICVCDGLDVLSGKNKSVVLYSLGKEIVE